mmetsp:Transcript_53582/g.143317  ORF Transcript_53582/g.143317 Transcript_53582/m.143317 type:complete len:211 (+) Transcript_53582:2072-2704(+)
MTLLLLRFRFIIMRDARQQQQLPMPSEGTPNINTLVRLSAGTDVHPRVVRSVQLDQLPIRDPQQWLLHPVHRCLLHSANGIMSTIHHWASGTVTLSRVLALANWWRALTFTFALAEQWRAFAFTFTFAITFTCSLNRTPRFRGSRCLWLHQSLDIQSRACIKLVPHVPLEAIHRDVPVEPLSPRTQDIPIPTAFAQILGTPWTSLFLDRP